MVDNKGYLLVRVEKGMYGLPQAGIIAQQLLEKRLEAEGYHQSATTPGYWTHEWRPISFSLVVDDFGVKYVGEEHANHLLSVLRKYYVVDKNAEGSEYCGIALDWDYENQKVHLSMPGYCPETLQCFRHNCARYTDQPHEHITPMYGRKIHYAKKLDKLPNIGPEDKHFIQQVTYVSVLCTGCRLNYACRSECESSSTNESNRRNNAENAQIFGLCSITPICNVDFFSK